jgi:glycosyltransferase involved in cell wall biosynthesis
MMKTSIVITTKNRKEDLRCALKSCLFQTVQPEIIVMDDGSTDGTSEMVKNEFPSVLLYSFYESRGYIIRRNEGAAMATGDILFSIDDDAEFSTTSVLEQTIMGFSDPNIGAIAIPYIEPHKAALVLQKAPDKYNVWLTDRFIGTAHALRRKIFLKMEGYRESLVHQGEEGDFCIRMLDQEYYVRLGTSDPIIHHESPKRSYYRMDYYGCRNSILFLWQNAPLPLLPLYMLGTIWNCLKWTLIPTRLITRIQGLCSGLFSSFKAQRKPVSTKTFRLWRSLSKGDIQMNQLAI